MVAAALKASPERMVLTHGTSEATRLAGMHLLAGRGTADGDRISYIRSTFAPEDGRCMCLFDGTSEEQVRRLNDAAGLPYERVVPALDLTP